MINPCTARTPNTRLVSLDLKDLKRQPEVETPTRTPSGLPGFYKDFLVHFRVAAVLTSMVSFILGPWQPGINPGAQVGASRKAASLAAAFTRYFLLLSNLMVSLKGRARIRTACARQVLEEPSDA